MWCCFRLRRRGWGCNCQAYKWSARWGRAAQLYLGEPGGPGWHWARHTVRNAVRLVLTQRLLITAGVDTCQLRPSTSLAMRCVHAAHGQPGPSGTGRTRCRILPERRTGRGPCPDALPPDFRSVHGLCPPRLCSEAGRPSAGGSPGGPLAAWLGVSHAAAPNCMAPGGMPRSQIMPLWRFRCTVVLRGHCLPGIHRPRLRRRTPDQGQPRRHRP
jgi:hypothetical protein